MVLRSLWDEALALQRSTAAFQLAYGRSQDPSFADVEGAQIVTRSGEVAITGKGELGDRADGRWLGPCVLVARPATNN